MKNNIRVVLLTLILFVFGGFNIVVFGNNDLIEMTEVDAKHSSVDFNIRVNSQDLINSKVFIIIENEENYVIARKDYNVIARKGYMYFYKYSSTYFTKDVDIYL